MYHTLFIDIGNTHRRSVDKVNVRQIERRQVFIMESGSLAAIRVIGLQRCCSLRVFDDGIYPRPYLLHDAKV